MATQRAAPTMTSQTPIVILATRPIGLSDFAFSCCTRSISAASLRTHPSASQVGSRWVAVLHRRENEPHECANRWNCIRKRDRRRRNGCTVRMTSGSLSAMTARMPECTEGAERTVVPPHAGAPFVGRERELGGVAGGPRRGESRARSADPARWRARDRQEPVGGRARGTRTRATGTRSCGDAAGRMPGRPHTGHGCRRCGPICGPPPRTSSGAIWAQAPAMSPSCCPSCE